MSLFIFGHRLCLRVAGVRYLAKTCQMRQRRGEHLLLHLFTGETVLAGVVNHVHRPLQVIHPVSHMTSPAKAVPTAGYGTSAIEYVLPTMGR